MTLRDCLLALFFAIVADELLGFTRPLSRWLIWRGARRAPPSMTDRLEEEWLAHLEQLPGKLSRLLFALDTGRAAFLISHHHYLPNTSVWVSVELRALDVIGSVLLLFMTLPVTLMTAIAIKIEDGWRAPIFYRSKRLGQGGRDFHVFSFRTHHRRDVLKVGRRTTFRLPRTRVGTLIRKLRINALPTLLNVFRGEMSFVGPRPHVPGAVRGLSVLFPGYSERLNFKPGITGWEQLWNIVFYHDVYFIQPKLSVREYFTVLRWAARLDFFAPKRLGRVRRHLAKLLADKTPKS